MPLKFNLKLLENINILLLLLSLLILDGIFPPRRRIYAKTLQEQE